MYSSKSFNFCNWLNGKNEEWDAVFYLLSQFAYLTYSDLSISLSRRGYGNRSFVGGEK